MTTRELAVKLPAGSPERIRQAHGGALLAGGIPGHRGAGGRPRSEVRQLALAGAARAIPKLITIVTNPDSEPRNVIAAARVLCEFGLGRQLELEDVTRPQRLTYDEVVADLTERLPRITRLLQERQRMAGVIAARTGAAPPGETRE